MSDIVLKVENLSKLYRLGEVGTGTLSHDLNRWWAKIRGKEDPFSKVGEVNDRTSGTNSRNGYVWSLKDINFEVRRGDVLGVIGKNGAGKSTLLKLISQITAPTTGSIKAKGRIASLLEVGTGMHPEMTGRENIYLNGTILGMRKWEIDRKFDAIVDFAGCAKYVDTPVKRYSSGMKVRLGFAVAAFLEPEILIVDEVLAVGDADFQKKAIGKMQEVSRESGRTVLFVSHNMASIQNLCNKGLLLNNGEKVLESNINLAVDKYSELVLHNIHNIQLDKRRDREGIGSFRFTKVEFANSLNNTSIQRVISGSNISVKLYFEKKHNDFVSDKVVFAIGFFTKNETLLFSCRSDVTNKMFDIDHLNGVATCVIPKFPLNNGEYFYNVIAYNNNEIVDWVKNAGMIEVEYGDFFGSGRVNSSKYNGVFVEHSWK